MPHSPQLVRASPGTGVERSRDQRRLSGGSEPEPRVKDGDGVGDGRVGIKVLL